MTSSAQFTWINAEGLTESIATYDPIVSEIDSITIEIRGMLPDLRHPDPLKSANTAVNVSRLLERYNQLCADLKSWNSFVAAQHDTKYQSFVQLIDALLKDVAKVRLIHELNSAVDGIEARHNDGALSLIEMFDSVDDATHDLIDRAAEAADVPAPQNVSLQGAITWVRTTPLINRADYPCEVQAYAWTDQYGRLHELRSIAKIEQQFIHLVGRLSTFRTIFDVGSTANKAKYAPQFEVELIQIQIVQAEFEAWNEYMSTIEQQSRRSWADDIERTISYVPE